MRTPSKRLIRISLRPEADKPFALKAPLSPNRSNFGTVQTGQTLDFGTVLVLSKLKDVLRTEEEDEMLCTASECTLRLAISANILLHLLQMTGFSIVITSSENCCCLAQAITIALSQQTMQTPYFSFYHSHKNMKNQSEKEHEI